MQVEGIIHVVDDDAAMRASLHMLLSSAGFEVVAYASGMELLDGLDRAPSATPCCLVTDVHMPGMGGLELQERLSGGRHSMPVVVITGQGDVPGAVRALKAGAVDFIEQFKPVEFERRQLGGREAPPLAPGQAQARQQNDDHGREHAADAARGQLGE